MNKQCHLWWLGEGGVFFLNGYCSANAVLLLVMCLDSCHRRIVDEEAVYRNRQWISPNRRESHPVENCEFVTGIQSPVAAGLL